MFMTPDEEAIIASDIELAMQGNDVTPIAFQWKVSSGTHPLYGTPLATGSTITASGWGILEIVKRNWADNGKVIVTSEYDAIAYMKDLPAEGLKDNETVLVVAGGTNWKVVPLHKIRSKPKAAAFHLRTGSYWNVIVLKEKTDNA